VPDLSKNKTAAVARLRKKSESETAMNAGSLAEMIAYQEGAVVSRALIKEKTGTVTVFAFAKREGLSEHTAPFDAMVYLLEGTARIVIDHVSHEVKSGEMIIMPANKPHSLAALEKFKMLLIMIKTEL
jgi:quercetin dioxygenase-like cupin family protein